MSDTTFSTNNESSRLTRELEALRRITRSINATSDLRSILNEIVTTVTEVLGADSSTIYLLDEARQRLTLKATTGLSSAAVNHGTLAMGEGLTGWAAKHRQVVAVRDAQHDPRFRIVPNTGERAFQSLMAAPLISQERVIGAINVQTRRLHTWTAADIEFGTLIADVVAGILERAVLEERNENRIRELTAVAEVSKAVVAPVYLDETLRVVAGMAAHAVSARRCSILLLDEQARTYAPRAIFDRTADTPQEPAWKLDALPFVDALPIGDAIIARNLDSFDAEMRTWSERAGLRTLVSIPLNVRDRIIGVLNMWAEVEAHFTEDQTALCTTLANQVALAIENAHLIGNTAIVQEMHHRVKNNLQNVVMLLQMQLSDDDGLSAREALLESINRIQSIAAVHDAMAHDGFRLVDVREVLQRVGQMVMNNMACRDQRITLKIEGDTCRLASRAATALTLVVAELIANSMEHAFPGCAQGKIDVALVDMGGTLEVTVRDNGLGSRAGKMNESSLGLQIVRTLVSEDLRGTLKMNRTQRGTRCIITVPISFVDPA
jgi:two-component sensor histidine kinase/putative methionine-R-sulfoxide reductase with GAF domain